MTDSEKIARMKEIYSDGDYPPYMLNAIIDVLFDREDDEDEE